LEIDKVEAFRAKFEEVIAATIEPHLLTPEIPIDTEISFKDVTPAFYNIINQMEPFGPDNTRPVFITRRAIDTGYSKIVKEQHVRFSLRQNGANLTGIGFNMAEKYKLLTQGKYVDIVFKLDENEWNGQKNIQMKVIDVRAAE
jgi:single-stranded-DNA-specific exonuclease